MSGFSVRIDPDNGDIYLVDGGVSTKIGTAGAGHALIKDSSGNDIDYSKPSETTYQAWAFGSDDAFEALTAGSANTGNYVDIRNVNPDCRTLVIVNEDNAGVDYDYTVYFSYM